MTKIATDIQQSKILAEILPLESADMSYRPYREEGGIPDYHLDLCPHAFASWIGVPAWSLNALLEIIPVYLTKEDKTLRLQIDMGLDDFDIWYEEFELAVSELDCISKDFVDACYEMIVKLNKKGLL